MFLKNGLSGVLQKAGPSQQGELSGIRPEIKVLYYVLP